MINGNDLREVFEFAKLAPIKGYPELHWTGKRPYESTQYYPARIKERYTATLASPDLPREAEHHSDGKVVRIMDYKKAKKALDKIASHVDTHRRGNALSGPLKGFSIYDYQVLSLIIDQWNEGKEHIATINGNVARWLGENGFVVVEEGIGFLVER
jgi:hypothetical protein